MKAYLGVSRAICSNVLPKILVPIPAASGTFLEEAPTGKMEEAIQLWGDYVKGESSAVAIGVVMVRSEETETKCVRSKIIADGSSLKLA